MRDCQLPIAKADITADISRKVQIKRRSQINLFVAIRRISSSFGMLLLLLIMINYDYGLLMKTTTITLPPSHMHARLDDAATHNVDKHRHQIARGDDKNRLKEIE